MEICARNIRSVQSLAAINALEARADISERQRRFRAGIFVDKQLEDEVLCPKPRRPSNSSSNRRSRGSAEAGFEILEIFRAKSSYSDSSSFGCSPPYFSGSPPARAANPLVRDVQFARQRAPPSPTRAAAAATSGSWQNTRDNNSSRITAIPCVRVEGFAADTCSRVSALA